MSNPAFPNGGPSDQSLDLAEAGYRSTTEVSRVIGLPLPGTFITNTLGIKPMVSIRNGRVMYWSDEQVQKIRLSLIMMLLRDAVGPLTIPEEIAPS